MTIALIALFTLGRLQAQAPVTEIYSDPQLGLSFSHPKTWVLQKPVAPKPDRKGRRGKVDKETVHFRVPIAGSNEDADLLIFRASFSGSPDLWQQLQVQANQNLKRDVQRQWQQEVLGVPMLLTRIGYSEDGNPKSALTGLLYNDWPYKLQFRLVGPSATFDQAQYEFTQALETLRTVDNSTPKAQQPDKAPTKAAADVIADPKALKHSIGDPEVVKKPFKAPVEIPVVVSTRKVVVRVPTGWTADGGKDNTFVLHNPVVSVPLNVTVFYTADSDPADIALVKASAGSLALFDRVDRREDPSIVPNRSGVAVASVWRYGVHGAQPLATFDSAAGRGEYYMLISAKPVAGAKGEAERKAIELLLADLGIEPAP